MDQSPRNDATSESHLRPQQTEREANPQSPELAYRRILARNPHDAETLHQLGLLCFHSGRRFEGLDFIRRSILAKPNDPAVHATHAILLGTSGRLEETIAAIQKGIALRPDQAPSHNNLGVTLEWARKFSK